jgi:hypothetical protein
MKLVVSLFVLCVGCDPVTTISTADSAGMCVQPGPADDCRAAGENICRLHCSKADGTPLWKTPGTPTKPSAFLADTCRRWVADGRDVLPSGGSRAHCLATITECQMVDEVCR